MVFDAAVAEQIIPCPLGKGVPVYRWFTKKKGDFRVPLFFAFFVLLVVL